MGVLENETTGGDGRPSEDRESVPPQDSLQVPTQKRRKLKSLTPLRGRSATPIRGRSQTPFSLYMIRRSATPSTLRSITPFLKREEREKTPFELGRGIKAQTTCNVAVFDQALVMDISEPAELQKPVRFITSDVSVIDRAAVMDVSNVEVIYVVEEYEEEEEEEEIIEEVKPKKKDRKGKRTKSGGRRSGSRDLDKEASPSRGDDDRRSRNRSTEREGSIGDYDEDDEPVKKGKKKGAGKKKDRQEKSPSPKMTLKLEIGGGQKANKKMFEERGKEDQKSSAKPPPKKSKMVLQMEEQARAAAKAKAEEDAQRSYKPKGETFEQRQKRLKAEKEEQERQEAEEDLAKQKTETPAQTQKRHEAEQKEQRARIEAEEERVKQKSETPEQTKKRHALEKEKLEKLEREELERQKTETPQQTQKRHEVEKRKEAEEYKEKQKRILAEQARKEFQKHHEEDDEDEDEEDEEEEDDDEDDTDEENEGSRYEDESSSRYGDDGGDSRYGDSKYDDEGRESHYGEGDEEEKGEDLDELDELRNDTRRSSTSSEGFVRPDPFEEVRWEQIAEEEGEEFVQKLRKYSLAVRKSEKQRDEEWKKRREQQRVPHFIIFLSDRAVEAGQKLRLTCAVGGPDLSVKWFKDGREIERDATHRVINNNNILILEVVNTNILHSGEYACVIENANDKVTSSCYVNVYEVFKDEPAPPTFKLIKEYYQSRVDELTIEVQLHGVPRPAAAWLKGGIEIKPSFKFTMLEEAHGVYKLLIYKPNEKDSGTYTCIAVNSSGEAKISHTVEMAKNLNYHVKGIFRARDRLQKDIENAAKKAMNDAMKSMEESDKKTRMLRAEPEPLVSPKQKLVFATHLRDSIALEGSTVRFICNVIGPNSTYRWLKDDKQITYNDKVKNLSEEGKPTLELKKVTAESSGVYKLIAKNEYCEINTSCYFKVYNAKTEGDESEPIFALPLRDVYHSSQNELVIDTKIRGNPRPTITWLKDRVPVMLDGRIMQIEHLDGICELIINKPTPSDNGTYICVATNKLGTQETTHSVVVDVVQTSRRTSTQSAIMNDSVGQDKVKDGAEKREKLPKGKKKDEEESGTYERRSKMLDPNPKNQLYFDAIMFNRYVEEGSKVKLQAVVAGPNAAMKWLKNDQTLAYGPRIRNMSRDCLASLEFLKALPEDTGVYTLVAQNEFCKITTSAELVVYSTNVNIEVVPVFVRPIKDTYRLNTNELILETGVRGQPTPKVQWFKDSMEVMKDDRTHITEYQDGTCELIIDRPNKKDSGKYTVIADNTAGKAETMHVVTFASKEHHIADNIHGVFHADKSLLKAKAVDLRGAKEWKTEEIAGAGEEEGKVVKGKGKGRPKKADDDAETAAAVTLTNGLDIMKKREKVIGIHFATVARDRVVTEGSKVKISCFLNAKEPQVKWFKNEEPLQNSPKIKGRYVDGLCTLEIPSASLTDTGDYKCTARDETGEASTSCKLKVYSDSGSADTPPTFTRNIKDNYQAKVNELHIECHVRGTPTASVSWVKDGIKIEPSDRYQQIDHNDGTCQLVIRCPKRSDSGKYVCQAENRAGKAEITHNITVEPRPQRPISPSREVKPAEPAQAAETEEEKEKKKAAKKKNAEEQEGRSREVPPPPDLKKYVYLCNYLSSRTVKEGSTVKWVLNIDGPEPTVRWFRGETPIVFGPKTKMNLQDNIAWLQLLKVTEEDSGQYMVKVKGPENEVISSCNLFVYSMGKEELVAPVFTVGIKDVYHPQTNHLVLECKVSGSPKPTLYWLKDKNNLSENLLKYKYCDLEDDIYQLIIQQLELCDTGLYTCQAENESDQMKISKFIDISDYIEPKISNKEREEMNAYSSTTQPKLDDQDYDAQESYAKTKDDKLKLIVEAGMKSLNIASGTRAQLICYIKGLIEDVYWLRGAERIVKGNRHKIYNINGAISLEIYDTRSDDSGEYTCVARNNRNTVNCKCQLQVYEADSTELPNNFVQPITVLFDAARCALILSCQVHGRPKIVWLRDNHTIVNNRYQISEEPGGIQKMIVRNPIPSDCGRFSCCAETPESVDFITKTIQTTDLKTLVNSMPTQNGSIPDAYDMKRNKEEITQASKKSIAAVQMHQQRKPLFNTLLHDRTVVEGCSVYLSCALVNDANVTIEWLKDKKALPQDIRYAVKFSNCEATLEISRTHENDSGLYTCRAFNDYGESFTNAHLCIYKAFEEARQPCVFIQSIRDTYSLNDNELVLDCRVRGKPCPDVQWMKGSDYLSSDNKYTQIKESDGYNKLIIHNPTEKDSGLYACVARNEVCENKMTHHVEFCGKERFSFEKTHGFFHRDPNKPHLVAPLGDQTVCKGGTIAINAEFLKNQLPTEVHWLRNNKALPAMPNLKAFYDKNIYTLAIMNAAPENEGTYTCRAHNAFGRMESHANVDISTGATKDERPPLFLSRPETEMKIAIGDPFSISFRIAPDPKPKLYFLKGTRDITKSDRVSKEASDDYTRFTVHKAQVTDSGTYWVIARNNNGTDRIFVTVEVMPRARSETPTIPRWGQSPDYYPDVSYFKDPPAAISTEPLLVDSGPSHISLSWGKPPSNNAAPVIAYRVDAWMVGSEGGAIWKELGLTPINSFDVFNLKQNIEYHFRVTPKNRYGWGPAVKTSTPMQVGGIECLPEFRKILPGQVKALLHTEFVLECVVQGTPRPEILWYKDGVRVGSHLELDRVKTRKLGSTCLLIIKNILETDAGRYTCEATNSKGRTSTFARLQVVQDAKLYDADHRLKEIVHNDALGKIGDTMPIFTMRLRDRRVQVSYPVRLTCQVIGYPPPEIFWLKNDQVLGSSRYLISSERQFHTLELISTDLQDTGIYTCTARNELGSVSCHCSLVVDKGIRAYISPEFPMPLDPVYICQSGQKLCLSAKVEAYPAVGVAWYRNSLRLRPSRRLTASLDNNGFVTLTIDEANIHDSGIYTCTASNAVGKAESVCRVCIEPYEEGAKSQANVTKEIPLIRTFDLPYSKEPMFVVKPRSSEASEGDTVIICCEVVGDPKPEVVWLRDFLKPDYYKDAPHFRRIGEGPEYRLEIPYAKIDYTGSYSIIASNCYGEAKAVISLQIYAKDILMHSTMEKGAIRHGNVETLPRFIRHLRPLRCCDGDAITLEAHVEGLPEPLIIWEKDGRVIPSGKDFTMTYDGIKATLSIPRIYPEDEGEYTCVAKNTLGRTLSSACIIVDVPEEKENLLQQQLSRPATLFSAASTPLSTPRSTPNRSFSPQRRFSYRNSSVDLGRREHLASEVIAAPKFLAIPNSRVVEEGDSVRFQCAIAGHPTPWCTWDKEGRIVTPTTRITVKEVDDVRFLEIEEVTFEDAGLYRITLENDYGRIEATARLDVITNTSRYGKSSSGRSIRASSSRRNAYLHRRLMGPSTAIGGRMALAAGFRGSSVPSCKFYHNGRELIENERTHIQCNANETLLMVDNVAKDDEGIYTCVIESEEHEPLATSTVMHFYDDKLLLMAKPPEIVKPLPEFLKCYEGGTIDLCLELDCSGVYHYVWTKDGEVIVDCEQFNCIDHGNGALCLRLHNIYDIDAGLYVCTILTPEGYKCCTSTMLQVVEGVSSHDNNLLILKSPLPALANIDDCVTFYSRVYPPNATTTWFVSGQQVSEDIDDEFTLESSETDGARILHIESVALNHSGEVQLVVTHPGKKSVNSSASSTTRKVYTSLAVIPRPSSFIDFEAERRSSSSKEIHISTSEENNNKEHGPVFKSKEFAHQPPYILERPQDCTALIGGCVRLTVRFEGAPKPQITWFKASRSIIETSNVIINTSGCKSVLQISDITADDSGKYSVRVMNEYGSDMAVVSVAVEGPPDPPSGKPSISQGPDRVAIAWCGPPYDGGCMLIGFILEMQELSTITFKDDVEVEETPWQEVASVVDSLAYTVKGLKPLHSYRFRVRAENIHGRSKPSSPSEPVQIYETREVYSEDLQNPIHVKSGGAFKDRFDILEELGKGRFGVVYKVQEKDEPKRILAAKTIKCIKARDRVKVQEEISIMRSLKHPKLLQLAATFESPREIVMVMEYIAGGELFERVVADDFTLTERDCILFVRQVCEGVAYMHTQQIVHLDLKPENIICKTRTCHQIKIIDFGLAQRLNTGQPVRVLFGTPEFIAPEIISYEPIGFQTDMWSVGVVCYVLLSGLSPFMGDTDVETFSNITRADFDFDDEAFDCVSQEAKDFITNLLVHRKELRWSAEQCLNSSWLQQLQHDDALGLQKICTDKLKKFIIRRKWQKTGNAIRALGRMANLSASRRNSAISTAGSLPCSPRPSISLPSSLPLSHFNATLNSAQMDSLHEEVDDFTTELPAPPSSGLEVQQRAVKIYNVRDKSLCSERSDSGYSECSNCSINTGHTLLCHCVRRDLELVDHASKNISVTALPLTIKHHTLQHKLQELARLPTQSSDDISGSESKLPLEGSDTVLQQQTVNYVAQMNTKPRELSPTNNNSATTVPIMLSDFTNTIKMRKKSLENSIQRAEKTKPQKSTAVYETPGKVSMLKNKFTGLIQQEQVSTTANTTTITTTKTKCNNKHSKDCMDIIKLKRRDCTDALHEKSSSSNNLNSIQPSQSTSLPNTPLAMRKLSNRKYSQQQQQQQEHLQSRSISPLTSTATFRLNDRVREVTDRLAQQQTICTEARRSTTITQHFSRRDSNKSQKISPSPPPPPPPQQSNRKKFLITS